MCRCHKWKFFRIFKIVTVKGVIRGAVSFIRALSEETHCLILFGQWLNCLTITDASSQAFIHIMGDPHCKDKLLDRFVMSLCVALVQTATQPLKLMNFDLLSFSQWQGEPRYFVYFLQCCKNSSWNLCMVYYWNVLALYMNPLLDS